MNHRSFSKTTTVESWRCASATAKMAASANKSAQVAAATTTAGRCPGRLSKPYKSDAQHAKYSVCFHGTNSFLSCTTAIARPWDFPMLRKGCLLISLRRDAAYPKARSQKN
jgi:predicted metal-binding protein